MNIYEYTFKHNQNTYKTQAHNMTEALAEFKKISGEEIPTSVDVKCIYWDNK